MPLAFGLFAPLPTRSPSDRTFTPRNSAALPVMRAKPIPSFFSTRGSKPQPSPYDVYCESSSAQVIGQLSLSIAARFTSVSKTSFATAGLAGYGPRSTTAAINGRRIFWYTGPQNPAFGSPIASPFRTTIRSRLGIAITTWCPAPAPANASRGASGHTPSEFTYQASPDPGA